MKSFRYDLFLYSVQGGWKGAEVEYYQIICSPTDFLTDMQMVCNIKLDHLRSLEKKSSVSASVKSFQTGGGGSNEPPLFLLVTSAKKPGQRG